MCTSIPGMQYCFARIKGTNSLFLSTLSLFIILHDITSLCNTHHSNIYLKPIMSRGNVFDLLFVFAINAVKGEKTTRDPVQWSVCQGCPWSIVSSSFSKWFINLFLRGIFVFVPGQTYRVGSTIGNKKKQLWHICC